MCVCLYVCNSCTWVGVLCALGLEPFNPDTVLAALPAAKGKTFWTLKAELAEEEAAEAIKQHGPVTPQSPGSNGEDSAEAQYSADADDIFMQIASDPRSNRSPRRATNSVRSVRFAQTPHAVRLAPRVDIFDFDEQDHVNIIKGALFEDRLPLAIKNLKRGTQVGAKSDVFMFDELEKKTAVLAEKKQMKLKREAAQKRKAQQQQRQTRREVQALRVTKKSLQKELKALRNRKSILALRLPPPPADEVYCFCHGLRKGTYYLECSGRGSCPGNNWFHPTCVGLTDKAAKKAFRVEDYLCPVCALVAQDSGYETEEEAELSQLGGSDEEGDSEEEAARFAAHVQSLLCSGEEVVTHTHPLGTQPPTACQACRYPHDEHYSHEYPASMDYNSL